MGRHLTWQQQHGKAPAAVKPMTDSVANAIAERDRFLEQHPEYMAYQRKIDDMLDKAGPPEKRMAVLGMLMEGKLLEMRDELQRFQAILIKAVS